MIQLLKRQLLQVSIMNYLNTIKICVPFTLNAHLNFTQRELVIKKVLTFYR